MFTHRHTHTHTHTHTYFWVEYTTQFLDTSPSLKCMLNLIMAMCFDAGGQTDCFDIKTVFLAPMYKQIKLQQSQQAIKIE